MFSLSWTPYLWGLFIRRCWFPSPSPHHHVRRLPGVYRTHCSWRREGNYCWAAADSGHDLWDVGTERHVAQHQGHKHRLLPAGQAASTSPLFLVLSCLLHVIKSIGLYQGVTVCLEALRKAFPESDSLQRTTKFFYTPTFRQSEAGISIGPNSSTPATSRYILNLYTTPAPAFEVQSQNQTSGSFSWVFFNFIYENVLFPVRFPVRRTLYTCTYCLRWKIPVWERSSPTLLLQSSMLSLLFRCMAKFKHSAELHLLN